MCCRAGARRIALNFYQILKKVVFFRWVICEKKLYFGMDTIDVFITAAKYIHIFRINLNFLLCK